MGAVRGGFAGRRQKLLPLLDGNIVFAACQLSRAARGSMSTSCRWSPLSTNCRRNTARLRGQILDQEQNIAAARRRRIRDREGGYGEKCRRSARIGGASARHWQEAVQAYVDPLPLLALSMRFQHSRSCANRLHYAAVGPKGHCSAFSARLLGLLSCFSWNQALFK